MLQTTDLYCEFYYLVMAINSASTRFDWQPGDSTITLAPHQQAAIWKCFELERDGDIIIMRDPPGAGKTYTTLGYIRALKENQSPFKSSHIDDLAAEFASSSGVIPDFAELDTTDITVENRAPQVREEISKLTQLLELDIRNAKDKDAEIAELFAGDLADVTDKFANVKFNELENMKMRISATQTAIDKIASYADKDRRSTSIIDIRANRIRNHSTTLIVVPYNIHTQWMDAIQRFGGLTAYSYCEYQDITRLYFNPSAIVFDYDILLTTSLYYDTIASVSQQLNIVFDRVIIDEVDSLNHTDVIFGLTKPKDKTHKGYDGIQCRKRWYVSASIHLNYDPVNLLSWNNIGILRYQQNLDNGMHLGIFGMHLGIFSGINGMLVRKAFFVPIADKPIAEMKAEFERMIIYTEPVFIATSFIIPDFINFSYLIYNRIVDNVLSNILDKAEIGKLNSSDYAALKLKFNMQIGRNIQEVAAIICKDIITGIEATESQLAATERASAQSAGAVDTKDDIARLEMQLLDLRTKYTTLLDRVRENDMCPVCMDDFSDKGRAIMGCCKNSFCHICIFKLKNSGNERCPMCRTAIELKNIILVDNPAVEEEVVKPHNIYDNQLDFFTSGIQHQLNTDDIRLMPRYINTSSVGYYDDKLVVLHKILQYILATTTSTPVKIMIYSDSHTILQDYLRANYPDLEVGYLATCGNKKEMDKLVLAYKRGYMTVLVSNPSMYGCGMNFENTTDLILMHSVDKTEQVIGRCQRFGRITPLKIWRIQYENEKNMP